MSRWFRFYADAMRNPKVARLADAQFRLWVELMTVAAENDGAIPPLDDLKHILKRRLDHLSRGLKDLISAGLMDPLGDGYEPHNWNKHQYKSDTSTHRVHKHRAKRNVSETPPETETETEDVIAKAIPSLRAARAPKAGPKTWRMHPDWMPGPLPASVAALADLWPPGRLAREIDQFRDFWLDRTEKRPGWDRTFHNRIRDIHDRVLRETGNGSGKANHDNRDGVAKALDRRIGLEPPASPFGRPDVGRIESDSRGPVTLIAAVRQ